MGAAKAVSSPSDVRSVGFMAGLGEGIARVHLNNQQSTINTHQSSFRRQRGLSIDDCRVLIVDC
jgi:hypothetical protein